MRVLFSGDWQTEFDNIDLCKKALDEVVSICDIHHLQAVVFCGDLKRQYNPIDIRVIQFWQKAIVELKKVVPNVIIVLGNHDRIGMYADAQNWLSILRRAGAQCFDKPSFHDFGPSRLFVLPFANSVEDLKKGAREVLKTTNLHYEHRDVLAFHADLANTKYNKLGTKSDSKFRVEDLKPENYLACIGGHIHLHQKLGENVYYTGSPFCTDWGEANQKKGYMVVDDSEVKFIPSKIPGWFDNTWPGYEPERIVKGSHIRLHVKCGENEDYTKALEKARTDFEKKHPGTIVFSVPEFDGERELESSISVDDTDEKKIKVYVDETLPENLHDEKEKVISYLKYKLKKVTTASNRTRGGIKFMNANVHNMLSWKELFVNFEHEGLVVIWGKNLDWQGRANGIGKTNFLQPIPIALFGTTFKGQKFDAWARNHVKEKAKVKLRMINNQGKIILVIRSRRPGELKILIDGKDRSSGMGPQEVQNMIVRATGFTLETLANSVYVDQEATNSFLFGTQKERKDILARFQNLERFDRARQNVKIDQENLDITISENLTQQSMADNHISDLDFSIDESAREKKKSLLSLKAKETEACEVYKRLELRLKNRKIDLGIYESNAKSPLKEYRNRAKRYETEMRICDGEEQALENKIHEASKLKGKSVCPTCGSKVDEKHLRSHVRRWKEEMAETRERYDELSSFFDEVEKEISKMEDTNAKQEDLVKDAEDALHKQYRRLGDIRSLIREQKEENYAARLLRKNKAKLAKIQKRLKMLRKFEKHLTQEKLFLTYCSDVFHRDGLPAFLNAQLVPMLNKAAERYSELFSQKEIQLRFSVDQGQFSVRVMNAHGGEELNDQSKGEKRMASLICSFAMRDIAPPTNVLILDEPGDGLDAVNARTFAAGLKKLKKEYETIFLTTHNQHILSELSGEKLVKIEKEKGISYLAN